ncbi:hypothetical protein MTsPCn9_15280 [Croceitalea sp. MTPC9]|nr:hypothetical protein MTsPCn6_13850 [Croceitalea sp. MTPC6]GMN16592.1 hypothetical protein MTsPCn9_15280 [Croceitalea sp. MTPC9]
MIIEISIKFYSFVSTFYKNLILSYNDEDSMNCYG